MLCCNRRNNKCKFSKLFIQYTSMSWVRFDKQNNNQWTTYYVLRNYLNPISISFFFPDFESTSTSWSNHWFSSPAAWPSRLSHVTWFKMYLTLFRTFQLWVEPPVPYFKRPMELWTISQSTHCLSSTVSQSTHCLSWMVFQSTHCLFLADSQSTHCLSSILWI